MRLLFIFLFLFSSLSSFSQVKGTADSIAIIKSKIVSFITVLDIANATKEGIYLNGYVVNIRYEKAKQLNGKKIRVTGKVSIIKGVNNQPGEEMQQGREGDTMYIESPKIKIIKN
jgi:hypothetical protein